MYNLQYIYIIDNIYIYCKFSTAATAKRAMMAAWKPACGNIIYIYN